MAAKYIATVIRLANSRKLSGRRVAGKEIRGGKIGDWIRPVSKRSTGELNPADFRFRNGEEPLLLDVIKIPMIEPRPRGYQSENHLIDDRSYWSKLGEANWKELKSALDKVSGPLWVNSSSTYERFLSLLQGAGVTAIADIRTSPHSRHFPQFNRGILEAKLREDGIAYSFLGEELGGRPKDRRYYRDGVADYERMAAAAEFQHGLKRMIDGARKYRIALMCAEQDPLDCHRCLLVSRALGERGAKVGHVLPDGRLVSQADIEEQLLSMSGRAQDDLFASREEQLAAAYRERAHKVAYAEAAPDATGPVAAE